MLRLLDAIFNKASERGTRQADTSVLQRTWARPKQRQRGRSESMQPPQQMLAKY